MQAYPISAASAALSSARELIPSFGNTRYRCVLIVRCERNSRWPISRFDRPCRGELGDLQLLGGELVARLRRRDAGCALPTHAARGAPGRPTARIRARRRCRGRRAGRRVTRRPAADVGAIGRTRAGSARAGTATVSGRPPAPRRSARPPLPAPRAARRACRRPSAIHVPGRSPALASTWATRSRASSSRSMCRAASARSAISQDEITGWYAESLGSNRRSAYRYASAWRPAASAASTLPNWANAIVMFAPTGSATTSACAAMRSGLGARRRASRRRARATVSAAAAHCGSPSSSASRLASSAAVIATSHSPRRAAMLACSVSSRGRCPSRPSRPQPVDGCREEVVAQVESADDECGRTEEASRVGVDVLHRPRSPARAAPTPRPRGPADPHMHGWRRLAGPRHPHRPADLRRRSASAALRGPDRPTRRGTQRARADSTCRSRSPAAPACSAAAISDVEPLLRRAGESERSPRPK